MPRHYKETEEDVRDMPRPYKEAEEDGHDMSCPYENGEGNPPLQEEKSRQDAGATK